MTFKLKEKGPIELDENGTSLLGTWTDKQLTAQEVHDNPLKYKEIFKRVNVGSDEKNIKIPHLEPGLYNLEFLGYATSCDAIFCITPNEPATTFLIRIADSNDTQVLAHAFIYTLMDYISFSNVSDSSFITGLEVDSKLIITKLL